MKAKKIMQQSMAILNVLVHIFSQLKSMPAENSGCIACEKPCLQVGSDSLHGPVRDARHVSEEILA